MPSIINADNGVVSGSAGLKSAADNSGVLQLQTNGNTALSISATSVVTLTQPLPASSGGSGLTSFTANGVFFAASTSAMSQSANLTFNGTTLRATDITDASLTAGRVTYAGTGGNLVDSANLVFDGTNMGIGTSSPAYRFDVQGGRSVLSANSEAFALGLRYNTSTNGIWLGCPSSNAFQISSFGGGAYLNIDSSGNVGIGTTTPRGCFDAIGTGSAAQRNWAYVAGGNVGAQNPTNFATGVAIGANFSNGNSETNLVWGQTIGSGQYFSISKWTGSVVSEQMRIDSSGNLLVGFTSASSSSRLRVRSSGNTSSTNNALFENSSGTSLFTIRDDGAIFLKTTFSNDFPSADINYLVVNSTTGQVTRLQGNPSIRISKANIEPMPSTQWLLSLNPITFNYRKQDENGNWTDEIRTEKQYGLIAEDLEKINSDFCSYSIKDGVKKLEGINYQMFIIPILKLAQELKTQNDELCARVAALEGAA